MGNASPKLIHQALGRESPVVKAGQIAAARCQKDTLVAVCFFYARQLVGHHPQCLVPGDALEFAFAAFTDPFLGIHQALGMVDILPEGPASQTGPELLRFRNIVAFNPQNSIVFDMQLERTSPTAIKGRSGADNCYIIIGLADYVVAHLSLLFIEHA
jgi:hypothetical protein